MDAKARLSMMAIVAGDVNRTTSCGVQLVPISGRCWMIGMSRTMFIALASLQSMSARPEQRRHARTATMSQPLDALMISVV